MHVHLDDAGVGRDLDRVEARIARRRLAFDDHRQAERARGVFHRGDEIEIIRGRSSTGGMKTCSRPWRGSTQSAVRVIQAADSVEPRVAERRGGVFLPARGSQLRGARRRERPPRGTERSGAIDVRIIPGSTHGSESSGRRRPIGESPGMSQSVLSRRNHGPLCQRFST